jgi:benzoate transport
MSNDPRLTINQNPMSSRQKIAVAIMVGLNALDGFDVLSISFAAPGISKEWGIDRSVLGFVLSMELIGMAIGSIVLGGLADKIGRRFTILGCLSVMVLGMFMAMQASSVSDLSLWRVLTGLGIGGMLAAINAAAAEFSNDKSRSLCLSLMVIGYPIGAAIGGAISSLLLKGSDWRIVFELGAFATLFFIPMVWFFVPETPAFLVSCRPNNALAKVNLALSRFSFAPVADLPPVDAAKAKRSLADIFSPELRSTTILITFAYFAHMIAFYFILKWVPKIVVDMGFEPSSAGWVLVCANIGGATGGAIFGSLVPRFGLKNLTRIALVMSTLMIALFGAGQSSYAGLIVMVAIAGMCSNAAIVGFYSIFAQAFPTHVRATGTGFAIGVGRGGSAFAPAAAGYLLNAGLGLQFVAITMGIGSLIGALTLGALRLTKEAE